jgi:hypothetical protein
VISPSRVQIEKRVQKAKDRWKTPLDNVDQLHAPRETERAYNVANFARQTVSHEGHFESLDKVEVLSSDIPVSPKPPVSPPPRPIMSPLSPSVYSRNTDGISILPNDSVMSFNGPDELDRHHNEGSAVILTSHSVRSYVVGTSPCRSDSARSSRDWKTWLSHEVSSMEFTSQEDLRIDEQYLTPSGKHRRESTRTSHTEDEDTTVILRPSCDTVRLIEQEPTPSIKPAQQVVVDVFPADSFEQRRHTIADSQALEHFQWNPSASHQACPVEPPLVKHGRPPKSSRRESISTMFKQRSPLTPKQSLSASQPSVESSRSAFMNDRFPFIHTGRSSSNNSSRSSRLSRSPHDSAASSLKSRKATPSPRIYSDLSAPAPLSKRTSLHVLTTAFKRDTGKHESKENITPCSPGGNKSLARSSLSPLKPTSRGQSLQPLSSIELNRSTTNMAQYTSNIPLIKHSKQPSGPTSSPPRPRLTATIRPITSDKLTRRPKSAFDLRGINSTLPRSGLELRRPALQLKASTDSLASSKEPSPGTETRVIDSILEEGERSGSTTPGQRMADRFLRERQSTGVLESDRHRGGMRLVREDTPAFL